MQFYNFGRAVCNALLPLYFHIRVTGMENLPPQGTGFILISNHYSNLDPVMLGLKLKKRHLVFMAKEELFHVPVLAPIIRKLGAFPVVRGSRDGKAVRYAEKVVREGKMLAMFPEGHRSKDGRLMRPKSGAIVIAAQTGAPIVPAAVWYEGWHFRARVHVHYGHMIPSDDLDLPAAPLPKQIKEATNRVWEQVAAIYQKEQDGIY